MTTNVYDFFPEGLASEPLNDQILYLVQNWIIANTEAAQKDSVGKYIDFSQISADLLPRIVSEMGYGYITDVLELPQSRLLQIMATLSLIHAMKGTKQGLLYVLNLLGFPGSTTTEWWETGGSGVPDTYDLNLDIDIQGLAGDEVTRFLIFLRNYVYPILRNLTLISTPFTLEMYALGTKDQYYDGSITQSV